MPMLAGLIDGAVGIDTEGDIHEVVSAFPDRYSGSCGVTGESSARLGPGSFVQDQMA